MAILSALECEVILIFQSGGVVNLQEFLLCSVGDVLFVY